MLWAVALSAAVSAAPLCPQDVGARDSGAEERAAAGAAASRATDAPALSFRDIPAAQAGVDFVHRSGAAGTAKRFMIECVGTGIGLLDVDDDGDLDLYCVQGGNVGPRGEPLPARNGDRLYLNDGRGHFTRDAEADLGDGFGQGVTAADVDGDEDLDVFVACLGPNRLLLNDGDGQLVPAPDASGLAGGADDWSMCGAFGDADGDGDLDVYVTNYLAHDLSEPMLAPGRTCRWLGCDVPCGPKGLRPQQDRFYLNDGAGHFTDATHASGFDAVPPAYAFQAVWTDVDGDGLPDLFVANDSVPNFLWRNLGPGVDAEGHATAVRFEECAMRAGCALSDTGQALAGMGVALGDLDGNGSLDLVMTNFSQEQNAVFLNESSPTKGVLFTEAGRTTGLGRPSYFDLGWGCSAFDGDLDGDLDLFVANGHVYPQVDGCGISNTTFAQRNRLYEQHAPGRFRCVTDQAGAGLQVRLSSRGCAAGDIDADGDVDLVVANLDAAPSLLRNESGRVGTFVRLDLRPRARAVGARVELTDGHRRWVREVVAGSSFLSAEDAALHFGVPSGAELSALVRWRDGSVEAFAGLHPGTSVRLERGQGEASPSGGQR